MGQYIRTPSGDFVDVTPYIRQRDSARRIAAYLSGAVIVLFALAVYLVTRPVIVEPCIPDRTVMQLDPETIRATPTPGTWL